MSEKIGKYDIVERIGRGGMGTVFKAKDPRLNRFVALKVISPDIEITDDLRTRFISEAQACAGLRHPNIVTIYDVGEEGERVFIVMELLDGQELKRLIADRAELDIEDKVWVMIQLCDALHYAHTQGIVHRDVKPGNVVVQGDGSVKVIDFGIAKMAQSANATRTGLIMGTIRYMSPEQVRGRADARSDQYSLGAVCYEMLSLRPPFLGDDPIALLEQLRTEKVPHLRELDASIPDDLATIVERAICRDAAERFPDLAEMKTELEEVRRRLRNEADTLRRDLSPRLAELRELQRTYGTRIGARLVDELPAGAERTMRLQTLQKWDHQIDGAIDDLRHKIARAEELRPSVERAGQLLEAGRFAEALGECEAVVAELPEHTEANRIVEEARELEARHRREILARKLVDDARAALEDGEVDLAVSILEQVAEIPPPAELLVTLDALRSSAAAKRQEHARLLREAERAGQEAAAAKARAEDLAMPDEAPQAWTDAESAAGRGREALHSGRASEALAAFRSAVADYARFESEVREARRKQREEEAREAEQRRREKEEHEAEIRRREAEAKEAERQRREAQKEAAEREAERARLEKQTREAEEKERRSREAEARQAEQRKREEEAREDERRREADKADQRRRDAEERARQKREAERQKREAAEQRRKRDAGGKDDAKPEARTAAYAGPDDRTVVQQMEPREPVSPQPPAPWRNPAIAGAGALLAIAAIMFVMVSGDGDSPTAPALQTVEPVGAGDAAREAQREEALRQEQAAAEAARAKEAALAEQAARAEEEKSRADAAAQEEKDRAEAAREQEEKARAEEARAQEEKDRAEEARLKEEKDRAEAARAKEEADRAEAARAQEEKARLEARRAQEAKARADAARLETERAEKARKDAAARAAAERPRVDAAMTAADSAREAMASAKAAAARAKASLYAADLASRAAGLEQSASSAYKRSDYSQAARLFDDATGEYRAASKRAGEKIATLEKDLEKAAVQAKSSRRDALAADADKLAADLFRKGGSKSDEAASLENKGNLAAAITASREASDLYQKALREAEKAQKTVKAPAPPPASRPKKPSGGIAF